MKYADVSECHVCGVTSSSLHLVPLTSLYMIPVDGIAGSKDRNGSARFGWLREDKHAQYVQSFVEQCGYMQIG